MGIRIDIFSIEDAGDEVVFVFHDRIRFRYLSEEDVMIDVEIEAFCEILERVAHAVSAAEVLFLSFRFPDGFVIP